jgi:2-polyprenyl-3-methyl-5-hydroxy-6-metoxy-1,4-benzoquinol methylase
MERIPEPELMTEAEQARAYAEADFAESNSLFVAHFRHRFPGTTQAHILDLGCGPGDISIRLAKDHATARVTGVDGADAMLGHARTASQRAGIADRVEFICERIQSYECDELFDVIVSNSLLHHLHDPVDLWESIKRLAAPSAMVMVMDLMRPDSEATARDLVSTYASAEAEILRRDFFRSLCAAFSIDEVEAQLKAAGLSSLSVEVVSDRHLLVYGRLVN